MVPALLGRSLERPRWLLHCIRSRGECAGRRVSLRLCGSICCPKMMDEVEDEAEPVGGGGGGPLLACFRLLTPISTSSSSSSWNTLRVRRRMHPRRRRLNSIGSGEADDGGDGGGTFSGLGSLAGGGPQRLRNLGSVTSWWMELETAAATRRSDARCSDSGDTVRDGGLNASVSRRRSVTRLCAARAGLGLRTNTNTHIKQTSKQYNIIN